MDLTETQLKVLRALSTKDNRAFYMRYMGRFNPTAYYFLAEGEPRRCTKQIRSLLAKGLVEKVEESSLGDHKVVINTSGKKLLENP